MEVNTHRAPTGAIGDEHRPVGGEGDGGIKWVAGANAENDKSRSEWSAANASGAG
jgi:hypothetical protein